MSDTALFNSLRAATNLSLTDLADLNSLATSSPRQGASRDEVLARQLWREELGTFSRTLDDGALARDLRRAMRENRPLDVVRRERREREAGRARRRAEQQQERGQEEGSGRSLTTNCEDPFARQAELAKARSTARRNRSGETAVDSLEADDSVRKSMPPRIYPTIRNPSSSTFPSFSSSLPVLREPTQSTSASTSPPTKRTISSLSPTVLEPATSVPSPLVGPSSSPGQPLPSATSSAPTSSPSLPVTECSICLTVTSNPTSLSCGHIYCSNCLRRRFLLATKDPSLYPASCCQVKPSHWKMYTTLSMRQREAYEAAGEEFSTKDPLYCSNKTCSTFLGSAGTGEFSKTCGTCLKETCTACKAPEHPSSHACAGDADDEAATKLVKQLQGARCERCKRVISRRGGCPEVICVCGMRMEIARVGG